MSLPEGAIEVAAEAIYLVCNERDAATWGEADDMEKSLFRNEARTALTAAMPTIRGHIAQEIESQISRSSSGRITEVGNGQQWAARIVRGGDE